MNKGKITAVVPIRKGSQRVKNKNFKPFAGKNLLEWKIKTLKTVSLIDDIVVNTNSKDAIEIAERYGVNYFEREEYYASSKCTNTEHWRNLAETSDADYIIHSPCTAPLITSKTFYDSINRFFLDNDEYDSLNTVSSIKEYLWLDGKPINYDMSNVPNSQDLPDIFNLTFGVSIISKEKMIKLGNVVGENPNFYKVDQIEGVDVDTPLDFEFAEFMYKKYRN